MQSDCDLSKLSLPFLRPQSYVPAILQGVLDESSDWLYDQADRFSILALAFNDLFRDQLDLVDFRFSLRFGVTRQYSSFGQVAIILSCFFGKFCK